MLLSIIVPCFNEEKTVHIFHEEIKKTLPNVDYEIIFVDDGSTDDTLNQIKRISNENSYTYISFSRNFGKESAICAGLEHAKGDYIVVMDVDLQDPPSLLPEMIETIENSDYDIVATRRVSRKGEPKIKSFLARLFYKLINRLSDIDIVDGARDYRLMTRQVVNAILQLKEYNRFSKGLFQWVGFNTKWIEYENVERIAGETSWSFWGLLTYSIEGIVAFTSAPLSLSIIIGIFVSILAFIFIIFIIVRSLFYSDPVRGWASTMCAILLLSGIQLFAIGILGKYLEKTYNETKNRPIYIIKESNID